MSIFLREFFRSSGLDLDNDQFLVDILEKSRKYLTKKEYILLVNLIS